MNAVAIHQMADRVAQLLEERLALGGRDLAAKLAKGGRLLPKRVRDGAELLADASEKARNPKLLGQIDMSDVAEAYAWHVAPDFKHHNPYFAHDRQSLLDAMSASAAAAPNKSFEVMQAIEDTDTVAVFSRLTRVSADARYAVVHILKFDHGKIVEMWDIVQEVPSDSPNTIGMF